MEMSNVVKMSNAEFSKAWPFFDVATSMQEPSKMRYDSLTDWFWTQSNKRLCLNILYVDLDDPVYNYLLIQHELAEAVMCRFSGVTSIDVDNFDFMYEKERAPNDTTSEPGDDPRAPYHKAHITAETIERTLALSLHVVWGSYMDACEVAFKRVKEARKNG